MSRFPNWSYIKVAPPKMLTFELGNMWWSSAQRWKALAEAILVRHFIFWTEKKIDSKNGLKVERKSRKMLVWHDALHFFSTFQLLHPRTCVSNESTNKGLIQINWEHGERGRGHVNVISKTRFWNHITQQQMRSRTSNTHRCNRHEQSFGGGKRIGSIRTSLHLQNREKHPKFQHFQCFAISTCAIRKNCTRPSMWPGKNRNNGVSKKCQRVNDNDGDDSRAKFLFVHVLSCSPNLQMWQIRLLPNWLWASLQHATAVIAGFPPN